MEEKEILEEELHRTIKYFAFMSKIWREMGSEGTTDLPGNAAYAYKQAAMFERLQQDVCKKQELAQAKLDEFDLWYLEHRKSTIDSSAEE